MQPRFDDDEAGIGPLRGGGGKDDGAPRSGGAAGAAAGRGHGQWARPYPAHGLVRSLPAPVPRLDPPYPTRRCSVAERSGGCTAGPAGTRSAGASRRRRWSPSPKPSSPPVCATSATSTCAPARTAPGSRPTDPGWGLQGYRWRVGELQPRGSQRVRLPHAARRLGLPQPDLLLPLPGAQAWHVCVSRPLRRPPL